MSLSEEDKRWILEQLQASETRFAEKLEATETRLLTALHQWASPMEARQRSHTAVMRALDAEMEYLADRIKKLEDGGKSAA